MLKHVAIAMAASTLVAGLAQAADLPNRGAPPPYIAPAPLFTWTGFYVGANAGYSFSNSGSTSTVGTPGFLAPWPGLRARFPQHQGQWFHWWRTDWL